VIGAGFAGMGAAIKLQDEGITAITIFERGADFGGTWRDNTYPGCACDIRSHLYSFSFFRNPDWTREFPQQPEIEAYLQSCAQRYGLRRYTQFNTEVTELRWVDERAVWQVHTSHGEIREFDLVITATGPLSRPKSPDLPGLAEFGGTVFHSAQWNHRHALDGERVAVIGTGASSVQFVPEIVAAAEHVTVFQRTAPWVLPREDRPFTDVERRRFRRFGIVARAKRYAIYLRQELLVRAFTGDVRVERMIRDGWAQFVAAQGVTGTLLEQVTPGYAPGCKRLLISNDWYPTLQRDDVTLETEAIDRVERGAIVTASGSRIEVDTIVFGTGFAATDFLTPMKVFGRDGVELSEAWQRAGAATYLGTAVHGFPNLFLMVGPNTGLGHNSIVFMMEAQLHLIIGAVRSLATGKRRTVEVSADAQAASYADAQRRLSHTVWTTGGCDSWYRSADGHVDTLWPGGTLRYWWATRRFRPGDFR
jgi:cation diffusion facilitator CzcD-associated flavoprotein CzcO